MRCLLKISLDMTATNAAIQSGALPKLIEATVKTLKPEASYFTSEDGVRTAMFVFDMKDSSQLPAIAEPWFMGAKGKVTVSPVMNLEDLKKGLEAAMKAIG